MTPGWNEHTPIYRQLKEKVLEMILDGDLKAGDALPSVRQVAAEYQLNPITVSKAYQELVDDNLVEKRRGIGMYMLPKAPARNCWQASVSASCAKSGRRWSSGSACSASSLEQLLRAAATAPTPSPEANS